MPPNDPRLLSLSEIEIMMDRESDLCLSQRPLRYCDECDIETYRDVCPICHGGELNTGDPVIDAMIDRKNKGEKVSLSDYFKRDANGNYTGLAFEIENQ